MAEYTLQQLAKLDREQDAKDRQFESWNAGGRVDRRVDHGGGFGNFAAAEPTEAEDGWFDKAKKYVQGTWGIQGDEPSKPAYEKLGDAAVSGLAGFGLTPKGAAAIAPPSTATKQITDTEALSLTPSAPTRSTGQFGEQVFSGAGATPFGDTSSKKYIMDGGHWRNNPDYKGGGLTTANSDPVSFGAMAGTEPGAGRFSVVGQDQFNNLMGFDSYKDSEGKLTSPAIREAELAALRRGESIDRSGPTFSTFGNYGDGSGSSIPVSAMESAMQDEFSDLISQYERGDISAKGMNATTAALRNKYGTQNLMALNQQEYDSDRRESQQENYFAQQQAQQGTFAEQTGRYKATQQAKQWASIRKQAQQGLSFEQGRLMDDLVGRVLNEQATGGKESVMMALQSLYSRFPQLAMQFVSGNPEMAGALGGREARVAANQL